MALSVFHDSLHTQAVVKDALAQAQILGGDLKQLVVSQKLQALRLSIMMRASSNAVIFFIVSTSFTNILQCLQYTIIGTEGYKVSQKLQNTTKKTTALYKAVVLIANVYSSLRFL